MKDQTGIQISIISACRNEATHIRDFLDSLLEQDLEGSAWEAIIADGSSDDGTRSILDTYAARRANLQLVSNPGRIVSTGLNAAIRAARGEYVIRMDVHTCYARDYCRRCIETLERTGADNVGGPARTRAFGIRARAVAAAYHSPFSTGGARFHDPTYEGFVDTVAYGCWRRETLERQGLFDEKLVRNQDDELNLRLVLAGGKIWQNPQIVSWYSPRATLAGVFRQYMQYGFWKVAVLFKHRTVASWRHLVPGMFVLANILLFVLVALSSITGAGRAVTDFATLWLVILATYAVGSALASLAAASQSGWGTLPYLPLVFATYHLSYGLGFLVGLIRFACKPNGAAPAESAFSRISR
jgi:succinoglycan biosynthesis protein ExoA